MGKLVFLGGTCGGNNWREGFIASLVAQGVSPEALFNPVVPEWNDEAQQREEAAKANSTHHVYYLADPMQEGNPISAYSLVEATIALHNDPNTAVVVFDTTGMDGHGLKAMKQTEKVLRNTFPTANIFATRDAAEAWLADQLAS